MRKAIYSCDCCGKIMKVKEVSESVIFKSAKYNFSISVDLCEECFEKLTKQFLKEHSEYEISKIFDEKTGKVG